MVVVVVVVDLGWVEGPGWELEEELAGVEVSDVATTAVVVQATILRVEYLTLAGLVPSLVVPVKQEQMASAYHPDRSEFSVVHLQTRSKSL